LEERLTAEHAATGGLSAALAAGVVDEVIAPARTRTMVAAALAGAPPARGAHTNIPL
jgi:acetyl-CoA/propionyl-CoA carboxylase carboxyl transferase subunit